MMAAPLSDPRLNHSTNMTASARMEPATIARCGVLRLPCVTDRPDGK